MPILAILAIAAIGAWALLHHPDAPKGQPVGNLVKGKKYILYLYAPPAAVAADVTAEVLKVMAGAATIDAPGATLMGSGVLPNVTPAVNADSWAIPITAANAVPVSTVDLDNEFKATTNYFFQALTAA